jgi:AraC family transcriptional regulator
VGIPKLWNEVNKDGTVDLLWKLNNGQIKGVLGVCVANSDTQKQVMDYWVATEYDGDIPDGLLKLEVPASKWAVFEVYGLMTEAMQKAWEQIFQNGFHPVVMSMQAHQH